MATIARNVAVAPPTGTGRCTGSRWLDGRITALLASPSAAFRGFIRPSTARGTAPTTSGTGAPIVGTLVGFSPICGSNARKRRRIDTISTVSEGE